MKIAAASILILIVFSAAPAFVSAPAFASNHETQVPKIPCAPNVPCIDPSQQTGGKAIRDFIINTFAKNIFSMLLGFAAAASVVFIIIGGIQMHLALGNEEALGKAKKTLIWAVVGLVISILSLTIVRIIANLPFSFK